MSRIRDIANLFSANTDAATDAEVEILLLVLIPPQMATCI